MITTGRVNLAFAGNGGLVATAQQVTPRQLLEIRERQWRTKLESVSLAAEVLDGIGEADRDMALVALRRRYRSEGEAELKRWPAVQVITTTGAAADHYERATFWPHLAKVLEVPNDQDFHRDWGEAFLDNLDELGLPAFGRIKDAGSRYVGPIVMHAGMPTYCLKDFYGLITPRRNAIPGLTPEAFLAWAVSRAAGHGLSNVDVPVQRFLRFGQEFALDVVDRAFDLLDSISRGGDGAEVPLPERFRQAARAFATDRGIAPVAGRQTGVEQLRPRITLDPFGQGLVLMLPPVGEAPDGSAVWLVDLDGVLRKVATQALWPGSDEPAPATQLAVISPVRTITVGLTAREDLALALPLVDDKDPLLVFDEDGTLLPAGLPVPAAQVWALYPAETVGLVVEGDRKVLSEAPLPPGWSGWRLELLDLSGTSGISAGGPVRDVRARGAAQINLGRPVPGVHSAAGQPVYPQLPAIQLPSEGEGDVWSVVSRAGFSGGSELTRRR